jgi:hypothetical protein
MVVLLSAMDPRVFNIGGISFVNASELAPIEIRNGSTTNMYLGGYSARKITSIDDVHIGDVGVRYSIGVGHVFVVIDKDVFDGQTVLLVASANQTGEGVVTIFEVDNSNFDVVFGMPAFYKVVLRK